MSTMTPHNSALSSSSNAPDPIDHSTSSSNGVDTTSLNVTFIDALQDVRNRDTLIKLYVWCSILFVLPLCVFYIGYKILIQIYHIDTHQALTYSGIVASCIVAAVSILFGIYAYYDDDDPATDKRSGVNWFQRDDTYSTQKCD